MSEGVGSDPRRATTAARWRVLGHPDGMLIFQARCLVEQHGWTEPAPEARHRVLLGRSGVYRRRLNDRIEFSDATSVVLTRPGDELSVSHPLGCGDSYTCLEVDAEVLAERPDAAHWLDRGGWAGSSDARLDLAHRLLVAEASRGLDAFELAERLHLFLGRLLQHTTRAADPPGAEVDRAVRRRPATLVAHRRLADRAREVLAGHGFTRTLDEVAREVGSSPHHLSRVFQRVTGESLTAYRNRLRVRAVLDTLAESNGRPLRAVAADHGFADQAHLTRVVRDQLGQPPAQLRRLLT
ncbi:helix-turn-helix domain-containing protein [Micromonospora yangpuensis]|uniref:AraC-type DNA-binding protein n=1 Tax=Micromonospora yangpuensis TaxID=683228 RepID=A0A1C6U756_9ACTN|nr:helix-turn-helix domain-containing protein [Micromonospora yangpuensis]GGL90742.1 AraC family transcriptional regulator [Micromonospora yangpuensis]SCL49669.1 AraC-type DNA-binding protein [Micromonospora yangpuensis]